MFWLIVATVIFILGIIAATSEYDYELFGVGFIISLAMLLVGALFSITFYDKKEVVFQYEELLGTMNTKRYSDNEFVYTLSDGSHKLTNFHNIKVKKIDGDIFIKYTETKESNNSFFKYSWDNIDTKLEIEMR